MTTPGTATARGSRSTSTQRSPSPIVYRSSALPADSTKGVKDITRKVLRQLEGLGHIEVGDDMSSEEEHERVNGNGLHAIPNGKASNGHTNGNGVSKPTEKPVDYEIPRKLLHGSIGFLVLYLWLSESSPNNIIVSLWSALAVIYPAELLRFRSRRFERLYEKCLGFLMRDSERQSVNGVVWYILGVNTVLSLLPLDVASVAIIILSWADTSASTIGRMYGRRTSKLPSRSPVLGLPLAPRKSVAGFVAASVTGGAIAMGFWGWLAPLRFGGQDSSWTWEGGIWGTGCGGLLGLAIISVVAGLVTGVAEALDLGSTDDNLSLPIISGTCLYGFFKLFEYASSWF
ncbi:hypothetical protein BKA70DRAFT_1424514 [Coprinopsis sp. MPI-PUGE-AT-0042]|nr:hypothetical protein BKA70DRAFT_1424514 [Coprinopsis sp. MPI-PUGE-AT-0042]